MSETPQPTGRAIEIPSTGDGPQEVVIRIGGAEIIIRTSGASLSAAASPAQRFAQLPDILGESKP